MKKMVSLLCIMALLCGCGQGNAGEKSGEATKKAAPDISGDITGEISVSCYDSPMYKNFLEEAVTKFEEKYPGTKVNVETVSSMPEVKTKEEDGKMMALVMMGPEDPAVKSDYISKVSTELMSGGGADIIAMDVVPYLKYCENGQLVDLSGFMEQDAEWNVGGLLKNVLDAVKYNGGQYILPINYGFSYFTYDSSLLDTPPSGNTVEKLVGSGKEAFQSINATAPDHVYMFGYNEFSQRGPSMFDAMLEERYKEFIDVEAKKVNINGGGFTELLETVKKLADDGIIKRGAMEGRMEAGKMPSPEEMQKTRDQKNIFKQKSNDVLFIEFNNNPNIMIMEEGAGSGSGEDDEIIGIAANSAGEVPFTFTQAFGINSNTKNPATAWAFLKFLLGEEMQGSMNMRGLPVNNAAREQKAEQTVKGQIAGAFFMGGKTSAAGAGPDGEEQELSPEQQKTLEDYRAAIEKFSSEINEYTTKDATIDEMVAAEVKYFFDGSKSAKEVADALQNKVELYLNE